jgi:hypothetical protein
MKSAAVASYPEKSNVSIAVKVTEPPCPSAEFATAEMLDKSKEIAGPPVFSVRKSLVAGSVIKLTMFWIVPHPPLAEVQARPAKEPVPPPKL